MHRSARTRVLESAAAGLVVGVVLATRHPWPTSVLGGWCAAALLYDLGVWRVIRTADSTFTRAVARREDGSRAIADLTVTVAAVASLVGVAYQLLRASDLRAGELAANTALAAASVVLSWATVQTVFTLRYARLYYGDDDGGEGGVDFGEGHDPDYQDFAYLAFTVGMTYQVSDTTLTTSAFRRAALRHALLSFVFGTSIIALTINIVAGLAR